MNETKELIFLQNSKNGNQPVIDICFKNGIWIPNAYSSDTEYLDISYDDNIIFEAQAISDLILFFIDNLKTYLSQKRKYFMKNRFAVYSEAKYVVLGSLIALFALVLSGTFSRREQFPFQNREVGVSRVYSPLENIPKGRPVSAKELFEHEEILQLSKDEFFPLLLRGGLRGGGGPSLGNPTSNYMPSTSKLNTSLTSKTSKPLPKLLQKSLGYEKRTQVSRLASLTSPGSISKIGTGNLSTTVDHSLNQRSLALISRELDSSRFIDVGASSGNRNDHIRDTIIGEALKATHQDRDFKGQKARNLKNVQAVNKASIIINKNIKMKLLKEMDETILNLSDERNELKSELTNVWMTSADMDKLEELEKAINQAEDVIRLETNQKDYYSKNGLNPDFSTIATPREPKDTKRDGLIAVSLQAYDEENLSREERKLIPNGLTSYNYNYIKGEKTKKNNTRKREEFLQIARKALYSACDLNQMRTKFAKPLGEGAQREITWEKRRAECPNYKEDDTKSRSNLVDKCVLTMIESLWIRE